MKQIRLIALLAIVATALGLICVYAKPYVVRHSTAVNLTAIEQDISQAQPQPLNIGTFVAQGLPIQFTQTTAANDKGASTLGYTLTNSDGRALNSVNLVLFDFNSAGKLMKLQSWNLQTDLKAGANEKFSLQLKHRATPGGRLILSADSVWGESAVWKVDFNDLANAAATLVAQPGSVSLRSARVDQATPESFGSAYCGEAFSKAFRLSKTGDEKRLTSFSCDRDQRLFAFGFNAKSLKKS